MSKRFNVQLGRMTRQILSVVVEVPDNKDAEWLEEQLSSVYAEADEPEHDAGWETDPHWGCDESSGHVVLGEVSDDTALLHKPIKIGFDVHEEDLKQYEVVVLEIQHVPVTYTVLARSTDEAWAKAEKGDTASELQGAVTEVAHRVVQSVDLAVEKAPAEVSAEALETYLLLVDVTMPLELLKSWPQEWLNTASAWATALHLAANDNDVTVPDCPFYVWPDNTTLKAFDVKHANLAKWDCVLINCTGEFRGKLAVHPLPGTPEAMVRRLAYRYFPQILGPDGSKWYVRQAQ